MSRTLKDMPYHAMEYKAVRSGFIDRSPMPRRHRDGGVFFLAAIPYGNDALAADWMGWMRSIGFSVSVSGPVPAGCMVTLCEHFTLCRPYGYIRDIAMGDTVVFDPFSISFLDSLGYGERPERNALEPAMSIRGADEVIMVRGVLATNPDGPCTSPSPDGDIDGWVSHMSRHDRRYRNCNRRHDRDVVVRERRNRVRESLRRAREYAADGCMDDGFDDPVLYGPRPRMEWV